MLPYPENTVWYIEARSAPDPKDGKQYENYGSGVAVWLQEKGKKDAGKKYLLTCAHVVRGESADGQKGCGPLLDELNVWMPDTSYARTVYRPRGKVGGGSYRAVVVVPGPLELQGDIPENARFDANDWVLLAVDFAAFTGAGTVVADWAEPAQAGIAIVGYPGGSAPWDNGVVRPTSVKDFRRGDLRNGILILRGPEESREGMSGGGLFNKDGSLVGLHRSSFDRALQNRAVAASHIRDQLRARGYEIVKSPKATGSPDEDSPPDDELRQWTTVSIEAKELQFDDNDRVAGARPLVDAEFSVYRSESKAAQIRCESEKTDKEGRTILKVQHPKLRARERLQVHFLVRKPPAPLVTIANGAVELGESIHILKKTPRTLVDGDEIDLQVIPYAKAGGYYALALAVSPAITQTPGDAPHPGADAAPRFRKAAQKLDLEAVVLDKTLNTWTQHLAEERPAVLIDDPHLSQPYPKVEDWERIQVLARQVALSVCYAVGKPGPDLRRTSFIVARNLVLVATHSKTDEFVSVGFGPIRDDAADRRYPVSKTIWRSDDFNVALLEVPGIPDPILGLASSSPFTGEKNRIVVVGYPAVDGRMPAEVNAIFEAGGANRKRVMPGNLLDVSMSNPIHPRAVLGHDATTSAGTSGGPVIDVGTGLVVGVHLVGLLRGDRKEGGAVPMWTLLQENSFRSVLEARQAAIVQPRISAPAAPVELGAAAGYDADFLPGYSVPLPALRDARRIGSVLRGRAFDYPHFSIVMYEKRALAWYTACNIDRARFKRVQRSAQHKFFPDPRVPAKLQRGNDFYRQSGFDKGHLISPSAVAWGTKAEAEEAYRAAFSFTNVTPQQPKFNQGRWLRLEQYVYRKLHPRSSRLCVFSGPICAQDDPKLRGQQTPREFWMIAVIENKSRPARPYVHAWILPQLEVTPDGVIIPTSPQLPDPAVFETTIAAIEGKTGLDFGALQVRQRLGAKK